MRRRGVVRDLGVCLNFFLNPDHLLRLFATSKHKLVGLLWRGATSGLSVFLVITICKSLVRSIRECASVAWGSHSDRHIVRLERIQRWFVKSMGTKIGLRYVEVLILDIMRQLHLYPNETRIVSANLIFLSRLLLNNGAIITPALLAKIHFRNSGAIRSKKLFLHNLYRTH